MSTTDISKYRAEIDAIDDEIIALLNKRSAIVKNVGIAKRQSQGEGICFIRAGREADMVRRIYDSFRKSIFPAYAAAQIWRTIISASLTLESRLKISVCESAPDSEIYWLTREYFGNVLPVSRKSGCQNVINDIISHTSEVGVVSTHDKWWVNLPEDIKVFGCIPFIMQNEKEEVKALALARISAEETGDDISLLKLTPDKEITRESIEVLFGKHGISARAIDRHNNAFLVEIRGFIRKDSIAIASVIKETGFAIQLLGAYAVPLKV